MTAILSHLTFLLAKQKKLDFKPRNDDMAFARLTTEPCSLSCEFLVRVRERSKESLSGRNAESFLSEIGVGFHTSVSFASHLDLPQWWLTARYGARLLLDHLKRLPISAAGGLMLTKYDRPLRPLPSFLVPPLTSQADTLTLNRDLAMYQDTLSTFSLPHLNDRYEMLRQLGNLYIVQPEILSSYLRESSALGRIENRVLRPFVMQRSDYGDYSKKWWDEILGEGEGANGTGAAGGGAGSGMGVGKSTLMRVGSMVEGGRSLMRDLV